MKHSAHFPWEPQPPPPETSTSTSTTSASSRATQTKAAANSATPQNLTKPQNNAQQIKQEAGASNGQTYANIPPTNPYANSANPAEQRAFDLVQQRFGTQTKPPVNSMGGSLGNIQLPGQQQNQQRPYPQQYPNQQYPQQQPGPPQQQAQQQQRPQGQAPQQQIPRKRSASPTTPVIKQERDESHLIKAQVDGAGDSPPPNSAEQWSAVMAHRNAAENEGPASRRVADGIIRAHVAQNMQRMQGGGLLVPLEERYPRSHPLHPASNSSRKGKARAVAFSGTIAKPSSTTSVQPSNTAAGPDQMPAQVDGSADSDNSGAAIKSDLDEKAKDADAINSDLDDSEDEAGDGMIGDDYEGNQIVCLYDKVQRVKNKWKCVLKDGVVDVDGKE